MPIAILGRPIERYLGDDFRVLASYGHVRDLPENPGKGKFGVDVDGDFTPEYVVSDDGKVMIVDEFTGRLMPGRRWSDGLHQAVEAKENVSIQSENQTLASITFQNFFRMYHKLSGMTGTADTEAYEFQEIYGLETVVIPTHHTMILARSLGVPAVQAK